jgi:hypothetical protein
MELFSFVKKYKKIKQTKYVNKHRFHSIKELDLTMVM